MEDTTTNALSKAKERVNEARAEIRTLKQRYERNIQLKAANAGVERSIARLQREISLCKRGISWLGASWEDGFSPKG